MTGTALDPQKSNRWPTLVHKVELASQRFFYAIDVDPVTLKAQAVFVYGGKEGSDLHLLANNVAILISLALQAGVTPEALKRNLKRPTPEDKQPAWPALFVPELVDAILPAIQSITESLRSAGLVPPEAMDSADGTEERP
jgi:hypothetical protein